MGMQGFEFTQIQIKFTQI